MKLMFSSPIPYYRSIPIKNDEGTLTRTYLDTVTGVLSATTYPAVSRRMQEMYGEKLNQMLNLITYEDVLEVNDRLKVKGQTYEIVGKMEYSMHSEFDLELVR